MASFRLPAEMAGAVAACAEREGVPVSEWMRRAVRDALLRREALPRPQEVIEHSARAGEPRAIPSGLSRARQFQCPHQVASGTGLVSASCGQCGVDGDDLGGVMGYPMTLRRVLDRNGLRDGDYGQVPQALRHTAPVTVASASDEFKLANYFGNERLAKESADTWNGRLALLAGDLRRLERDTLDEGAICKRISERTGVDADSVAAVLKAYLEF